jgi:hypothetical protein
MQSTTCIVQPAMAGMHSLRHVQRVVGSPALLRPAIRPFKLQRHAMHVRTAAGAKPTAEAPTLLVPPTLQATTKSAPLWQRLAQQGARWAGVAVLAAALAFSSVGAAEAARSGGRMGGRSFNSSSSSSGSGFSSGRGAGAGAAFGGAWGSGSSGRSSSAFRSGLSSAPLGGAWSPRTSLAPSSGSVRTNSFFLSPFGEFRLVWGLQACCPPQLGCRALRWCKAVRLRLATVVQRSGSSR